MSVIDDYLKNVPAPEKMQLERIRNIVQQIFPDAEEVISYGMPGFKYKDGYLVGFNAFKDHLSLFPTGRPVEFLQDKLTDYKLSKGTIQFSVDHPIPEEIIKELLQVRAKDISGK